MESEKIVVSYIGNYYKVPEMIIQNDKFELKSILCESEKISDDLITFSLVRSIPLYRLESRENLESIVKRENKLVDFFIMCSFGKRIPMENLDEINLFNIHYSLLPYYKGRHPTFWATVLNEKKVGISIHKVTHNIDEGDIVSQRMVPYYIWMDEDSLFDSLTEKIPCLLEDFLDYIENKKTTTVNMSGNYFPIVNANDYTINLDTDNFGLIYNKVRAQSKYKGAKILLGKNVCWIKDIKFTEMELEEVNYIVKEDKLFIKINDSICIVTEHFLFEEEMI